MHGSNVVTTITRVPRRFFTDTRYHWQKHELSHFPFRRHARRQAGGAASRHHVAVTACRPCGEIPRRRRRDAIRVFERHLRSATCQQQKVMSPKTTNDAAGVGFSSTATAANGDTIPRAIRCTARRAPRPSGTVRQARPPCLPAVRAFPPQRAYGMPAYMYRRWVCGRLRHAVTCACAQVTTRHID